MLVVPVQRIRCGTPEPRDLLDRVALSLIVRRGVKKVAVVTHRFVPSSSTGLLSNDLAVISVQCNTGRIYLRFFDDGSTRKAFVLGVRGCVYSVDIC